jgi:homoserine kinase
VYVALKGYLDARGYRPGRLILESRSEIPVARGLGSSAAAALAGFAAGALLAGEGIDRDDLLELGMGSEGHGDNVAPCLYGGLTLVTRSEKGGRCLPLDVPADLGIALAVPDFALATERARRVLPSTVPLADAVHNQARLGLLIGALASGRVELLGEAMEDRLHEPYRSRLIPGFAEVKAAALEAGALGAALSGSGPTVLALVRSGHGEVGEAMRETWARLGVSARSLDVTVDQLGLQAERLDGTDES